MTKEYVEYSSGAGVTQEYRITLKKVDDRLATEDLERLKFLCRDCIRANKLESIHSGLDLFDELERMKMLGPANLSFLAELLHEAQRVDLMKKIGVSPADLRQRIQENHGENFVSKYRLMLHHLSDHMIQNDVHEMKRLLKQHNLPRSRLDDSRDAYSLFTLLEQQGHIAPDDTDFLLQIVGQMEETELSDIVRRYSDEFCASKGGEVEEKGAQFVSLPAAVGDSAVASTVLNADLEYKVTRQPRGICIIVNNAVFKPEGDNAKRDLGHRLGSDVDAAGLERVFKTLNFRVKKYDNLRSYELLSLSSKLADLNHSKFDVFVMCILTHGDEGIVFGTDCQEIPMYKILSKFRDSKCKTLKDKPKVFFVQACQGSRVTEDSLDSSIPYQDGYESFMDLGSLAVDSPRGVTSGPPGARIPRQADFLIGLATVPGHVSYRSRSKGSWYINALCQTLDRYHNSQDLLSMLTIVNKEVCDIIQLAGQKYERRQIPLPQTTLRKKLFFRTE